MSYHQRTLPHWQPEGAPMFVTWRLFGTLPAKLILSSTAPSGQSFVFQDRRLDRTEAGPLWLRDHRIAQSIVDAFWFGQYQLKFYELHAYVVMPNHVHVLLQPNAPLSRITKSIKGYTARQANQLLGRTGSPFWHYESYDHWVRNQHELQKVIAYIEGNPVSAGFVSKPEDWRWSSAHAE